MTTTLKQLAKNPNNPRTITDQKRDQLAKSVEAFGPLDGFVYNERTARLISGHQRQDIFDDAAIKFTKYYRTPTRTGTTAIGYLIYKGDRHPVRYVQWGTRKEKAAMIAANRNGGSWDEGKLKKLFQDLAKDETFDMDTTMFDESERENILKDPIISDDDEDEGSSGEGKKSVCPACGEEFLVAGRK